jgi:hypothetical protein
MLAPPSSSFLGEVEGEDRALKEEKSSDIGGVRKTRARAQIVAAPPPAATFHWQLELEVFAFFHSGESESTASSASCPGVSGSSY